MQEYIQYITIYCPNIEFLLIWYKLSEIENKISSILQEYKSLLTTCKKLKEIKIQLIRYDEIVRILELILDHSSEELSNIYFHKMGNNG